jgi:hypothetical protein
VQAIAMLGAFPVTLASLRPTEPTDLTRLSEVLRNQNTKKAALPAALPEPFLIAVARDLRTLEDPDEEDEAAPTCLAGPMMLVLSIMLGSQNRQDRMSISESALFNSLKTYQWAVEREIVTRLTGVGGAEDMDILLKRLAQITADDCSDPMPA